ncbi:unnamed protein product [Parnassius mnemosyne]|uniref:Helitron helicase-like domain-containing protein n=1 Tax=Parnassius mnemosyne TaxID=213953 RepID=A0AAV1K6F2_9NEOP
MYSIEWQKRGLPHTHILIWLKEKLQPSQIDDIISAEIPDPGQDKELYDTIVRNMIHGPCGARNSISPCIKEGKCTKKFPKQLLKETQLNAEFGFGECKESFLLEMRHSILVLRGDNSYEFFIINRA